MPKILIFDIETSFNELHLRTFQLLDKQPRMLPFDSITRERNILTSAWKWLGEKKTDSIAVSRKSPDDDKQIVKKMLSLFEEADAVVAHYGDKFDMKYILTRAVYHNLPPPPPVKQIDTYKIAKSKFLFNCNRLDYLGKFLGLGRKIKTNQKLWDDCMDGKQKAINDMATYNRQDVDLLEKVYKRLCPFVPPKVNAAIINGNYCCPGCGSKSVQARGFGVNRTTRYQKYQCRSCGLWSSSPVNKPKKIR